MSWRRPPLFSSMICCLLIKESFYRQKSIVDWILEGDQNTAFFHKSVTPKMHRDSIKSLIALDGSYLDSFAHISNEVVSFFQKLHGEKYVNVCVLVLY